MGRKAAWTEKRIKEKHQRGDGQGELASYKPWLTVSEVASNGRSRRPWSWKTGRKHELFSDVEHDLFLLCEWSRSVVDIWEQYPLQRDMTQTIANQLGIRHPAYVGTHVPTVMTVDFLLTVSGAEGERFVALNAKRTEEAEDETSLEKLEVQRTYFAELGIQHHLIYHSRISERKVNNIFYVRTAQLGENEVEKPYPGYFDELKGRMSSQLHSAAPNLTLAEYCSGFDADVGSVPGTGLRVAKMLMQERALAVDLDSPDLSKEPMSSFLMTSRPGQLRAIGGK